MNWRIVKALVVKDLALFTRNRLFAIISILGLFAYIGIFFAMPRSVDESLDIGLYVPGGGEAIAQSEYGGLSVHVLESEQSLKDAVTEGRYQAGVALPEGFAEKLVAGEKPRVNVYFAETAPQEVRGAIVTLMEEMSYLQSGQTSPVEISEEVLGRDMAGMQVPPRNRMIPLFAVLILMMETLALASLISEEVVGGTIRALLITPMTIKGLFLGKGITGVGLAFGQATLFMAATGGLNQQALIVLAALFLGALLVTAIGFLIASVGKDLMSVMAWGVPSMLVLGVPAFGIMFPGVISDWIKAVPTHYLVDTLHRVANLEAGWSEVWTNLMILLAFDVVLVYLGVVALGRKLR